MQRIDSLNCISIVGFEVLTAMSIKDMFSWILTGESPPKFSEAPIAFMFRAKE
jgi:hypothetical protein